MTDAASTTHTAEPVAYTVKGLAALIRTGDNKPFPARTIRKWCMEGKIPGAYKIGGQWLIPQRSLDTMFLPPNVSIFRRR